MVKSRLAVLAASMALGVACTGERSDRPAADSVTSDRAAAAAAGGTPPAAAALTERGLGPLRVGMTVAEASAALGGALALPAGADPAGCAYAAWRGGPAGVRVMVEGGRVARVDVDSGAVATAAGARVGDAEARVLGLYGGRAAVSPHKYEAGHYLTVRDPADSGLALVFETAAGRVTRFRGGRRPQVEYVEGCA